MARTSLFASLAKRIHPLRRSDVLFVLGAAGFIIQMMREQSDSTLVFASLGLMGLPFVGRFDPGPPPAVPPEQPPAPIPPPVPPAPSTPPEGVS
jgi:hypothetical protein